MEACAVICRKATFTLSVSAVMLSDANSSFPEHKIGVFVREEVCCELYLDICL